MNLHDELWRASNPGASAARGVMYASAAGLVVWVLFILAAVVIW